MRIGIDLDGVLLNAYNTIKKEYEEYKIKYPENIVSENKLIQTSDHTTLLNGNVGDFDHFFDITYKDYYQRGMIQEGAREFVERLKSEGHEIFIVTSRTSWEYEEKVGVENIKNWTREWVEKNNILADEILFCPGYCKSKPIVENDIEVMIDDHIKNVYETSKLIPTIWFDVNEDENAATFGSNYQIYKTHDFNLMFNIINYRIKAA